MVRKQDARTGGGDLPYTFRGDRGLVPERGWGVGVGSLRPFRISQQFSVDLMGGSHSSKLTADGAGRTHWNPEKEETRR